MFVVGDLCVDLILLICFGLLMNLLVFYICVGMFGGFWVCFCVITLLCYLECLFTDVGCCW